MTTFTSVHQVLQRLGWHDRVVLESVAARMHEEIVGASREGDVGLRGPDGVDRWNDRCLKRGGSAGDLGRPDMEHIDGNRHRGAHDEIDFDHGAALDGDGKLGPAWRAATQRYALLIGA